MLSDVFRDINFGLTFINVKQALNEYEFSGRCEKIEDLVPMLNRMWRLSCRVLLLGHCLPRLLKHETVFVCPSSLILYIISRLSITHSVLSCCTVSLKEYQQGKNSFTFRMDARNSFRSIVKWICAGGTYRLFIMSDTSFQLQDLYSGTLEKIVNQCGRQYTGIGVRSWVSFSSFFVFVFFPRVLGVRPRKHILLLNNTRDLIFIQY